MRWAGGSQIIRIPKDQRQFISILERDRYIENQQQLIELALAIGLREGLRCRSDSYDGQKHDAAKVGQLDPDETLSEAIMARYAGLTDGERFAIVTEHIIAGIERIQEHYLENEGLDMGRLLKS